MMISSAGTDMVLNGGREKHTAATDVMVASLDFGFVCFENGGRLCTHSAVATNSVNRIR